MEQENKIIRNGKGRFVKGIISPISFKNGNLLDSLRCQEHREKGHKVFVFWEREIKVVGLNDLKLKLRSL